MENIEQNESLGTEQENNLVENVAENVENTTEQTPKLYTEDELNAKVNEIVGKRVARKEAKIRKEYDAKYGNLTDVLRAGTGKEDVDDLASAFREFYEKKGIKIPEKPSYSDRDIEVLAKAEAEDIIRSGYEEVVEEVDRLAKIGVANMSSRDKAIFMALAAHRQSAERGMELSKLGVTEDVYNSKEFTDFASKFNPNTPIKDIYDIYQKTLPKKTIKPMGSMKSNVAEENGVKDFYSYEEAVKFTKKDFDKNPELYRKVQESMTKWK